MNLTLRGTLQGKKKKKKNLPSASPSVHLQIIHVEEGRSRGEANSSLYLD